MKNCQFRAAHLLLAGCQASPCELHAVDSTLFSRRLFFLWVPCRRDWWRCEVV